ncbi:MAG: hypothetical protein LBV48_01275 [Mycoplasmataceae bacterium]|nr:hypothetical protein [Mycoplasmataceae bacterium]
MKKLQKSLEYHSTIIRFKGLLKIKTLHSKIIFAVFIGVLSALMTTVFVKNTTLYAGGTSALFIGLGRLVRTALTIVWTKWTTEPGSVTSSLSEHDNMNINIIYNVIFWGGYLAMNIPLFILAYRKVGKQFALISFAFILSDRICGFLFGLLGDNFTFNVFGSTSGMNTYVANNYKLDVVSFFPDIFPSTNNLDWNSPWTNVITSSNDSTAAMVRNGNYSSGIALIFYAVIFACFSALITSALFIIGGSTAGSDFITVYYSVKTHSDVGRVYMIINASFMTVGYILGSYVSGIMIWTDISKNNHALIAGVTGNYNHFADINNLFSANLLVSLLLAALNGIMISKIFPSKKLVKCEIISDKLDELDNHLFDPENTSSIIPLKRAKNHSSITFICSYLDFVTKYNAIKAIDPKSLLVSDFVEDIDGPFDLYKNNFKN